MLRLRTLDPVWLRAPVLLSLGISGRALLYRHLRPCCALKSWGLGLRRHSFSAHCCLGLSRLLRPGPLGRRRLVWDTDPLALLGILYFRLLSGPVESLLIYHARIAELLLGGRSRPVRAPRSKVAVIKVSGTVPYRSRGLPGRRAETALFLIFSPGDLFNHWLFQVDHKQAKQEEACKGNEHVDSCLQGNVIQNILMEKIQHPAGKYGQQRKHID